MARTIFQNIVVHHYDKANAFINCPYAAIRFFEILFIEEGEGELNINEQSLSYGPNQLYILVPNDKYTFQVNTPTTVSTIKFLNSFFAHSYADDNTTERKEWFRKIEIILHSTNRKAHIKFHSTDEESSIQSLLSVICKEYNNEALKNELIIKNMLHAILHIISRNIGNTTSKAAPSKIQEIINHIHTQIYEAEQLSNKALATKFNIAENYIGQYFKKQAGISLKKYILNYKIKLAETRLTYTDLTLSEIALELGFTDSSHLDKTFISYKGITPGAYRLNLRLV